MKKLLFSLLTLLVLAIPSYAQQGVKSKRFTIAGPDSAINLVNTSIAWHQLTWSVTGTASACTVALDTSSNGTTWTAGGAITGQNCTTNGSSSVVNVSASYVRIDMTALTISAGGSVTVTWDGWTSNPTPSSGNITGCTTTGGVAYQNGTANTLTCGPNFVDNGGEVEVSSVNAGTGPNLFLNNLSAPASSGILFVPDDNGSDLIQFSDGSANSSGIEQTLGTGLELFSSSGTTRVLGAGGTGAGQLLLGTTGNALTTGPLEIHVSAPPAGSFYSHSNTNFQTPEFDYYRSRGTQASPTAILLNDQIQYQTWNGYDGSTYFQGNLMFVQASENWDATHHGNFFDFYTVPTGSNASVDTLHLGQGGRSVSLENFITSSTKVLGFTTSVNNPAGDDTGFSRTAAATVALGNGTAADTTGTFVTGTVRANTSFNANGTAGVTGASCLGAIASTEGLVTTCTAVSDFRVKTNIHPLTAGLAEIMKLHPSVWQMNAEGRKITGLPASTQLEGFIAQDVQKAIPAAVGIERHDGVDYLSLPQGDRPIVAALVNAVKEQQKEIEHLKAEINILESK